MNTAGLVICLFILRVILVCVLKIINLLPLQSPRCLKVINFLQKDLFFKQYHSLVIEPLIELQISVYFTFRYLSGSSPGDIISHIITGFTLFAILMQLPFSFAMILCIICNVSRREASHESHVQDLEPTGTPSK